MVATLLDVLSCDGCSSNRMRRSTRSGWLPPVQCAVRGADRLVGDVAKTYFDKILQWLAETPDGKFPKVKIEQHPKGGTQQIGGCVPRFSQIFRGRNEQTDLCWLHWNPSVV